MPSELDYAGRGDGPVAGPARGWSPGASRSPREARRLPRPRPTGAARSPASAPPTPRWLVVGLAPAAHGGNRTGRMFTGDRSGDVALRGAARAPGLANQPTSTGRGDGLALHGARITAPVHCAPPANKPTPGRAGHLPRPGWRASWRCCGRRCARSWCSARSAGQALLPALAPAGWPVPPPRPAFGHGAEARPPDGRLTLLGCYHVSQQNTFTGRLTAAMLDDVCAGRRTSRDRSSCPSPG